MAKRKRNDDHKQTGAVNGRSGEAAPCSLTHAEPIAGPLAIQIVTGAYERVLHGFVATLTPTTAPVVNGTKESPQALDITFSDTFLFAAHSSAIRCLALSHHVESKKCILATGGADERINLYSISTVQVDRSKLGQKADLPSLSNTAVVENPRNRELGSLMHHSRPITRLCFPTNGKFFSAGEDNAIAISRTRDWTVLSTIKAPIPKPIGRPSGDTAGPGEVPAGVNDFAIHPSMKLMMSVGRGEKCMRLWNLVTGKKAGVLNFEKDLLRHVGEGRYDTGEGRKVIWTRDGQEFVVCFEKGAAIFGMDCKARAIIKPSPPTKLHEVRLVPARNANDKSKLLAISTEDGRVLFFDLDAATVIADVITPVIMPQAQLGGVQVGAQSRVKGFTFLRVPDFYGLSLLCVTGSSDGSTRIWSLHADMMGRFVERTSEDLNGSQTTQSSKTQQVGELLAIHSSMNRITCLEAFVMDRSYQAPTDAAEEDDFAGFSSEADGV